MSDNATDNPNQTPDDIYFMALALAQANKAYQLGEVPVGAVIVYQNQVVAAAFNCPITSQDATHHAEIVALRQAYAYFGNYRLPQGCTLYITLEPCTMCLGAMVHSRVSRVVYGACEPKAGVIVSQENFADKCYFNHQMNIVGGILAQECGAILSQFFRHKRKIKKLTAKARKAQIS